MKHRQLAQEYGIRGYEPGGIRKVPKSRGERLAERCGERLVAHRSTSLFADPPVQAFQGPFGHNAGVLLQILTNNGERFEGLFTKVSQGGKAWGRVEKERSVARAAGWGDTASLMASLELHEHSLTVRSQIHGLWSDKFHSDVAFVSAEDLRELIREYNDVAPTWEDPIVSLSLLRKAERIMDDTALVGRCNENTKLRVLTAINITSLYRRRGKLQLALRSLQSAKILVDTLGAPPTGERGKDQVSAHALCVLRLRATGLLNLDDNGMGGLSDPFIVISRTLTSAEHTSATRQIDKGGPVGKSWRRAADAAVLRQVHTPPPPGNNTHAYMVYLTVRGWCADLGDRKVCLP